MPVYRLLLSSFFQSGLLSVAFILFGFSSLGKRLEAALGSLGFLSSIVSQIVVNNLLHTVVCLTLAYNPVQADKSFLLDCGTGFWVQICFCPHAPKLTPHCLTADQGVFLGLTVIECSLIPVATRRLLFLPVEIPTM